MNIHHITRAHEEIRNAVIATIDDEHRKKLIKCGEDLLQILRAYGVFIGNQSGTHSGRRLSRTGKCECCSNNTNWVVDVCGRDAYWCGCGRGPNK